MTKNSTFPELRHRAKKAGQPPGTAIYTGEKKSTPTHLIMTCYSDNDAEEIGGKQLTDLTTTLSEPYRTWIDVEGLSDVTIIEQIAEKYALHPLTVEDILNVSQRPKVEEFNNYLFVTLKVLLWNNEKSTFSVEQFSLAIGENFLLSFQESDSNLFDKIRSRFQKGIGARLHLQGTDYLAYRLIDTIVDQYFVVLEALGDKIEDLEETIVNAPTQQNSRNLYRIKRQVLMLRKAIWPMREAISNLLRIDGELITPATHLYYRDLYDHVAQAIDSLEVFRDMMSSILDVYLSSLSNRMNEIMKVLTIIATIFIPITFIASLFGMNFKYMPELAWRWSYPAVLVIMVIVVLFMLRYFRKQKWL